MTIVPMQFVGQGWRASNTKETLRAEPKVEGHKAQNP